jgi:hypothetical protein
MQAELIRNQLMHLLHQVPFQSFFILLDSGDRILIEHPENIAFDPGVIGQRPGSRHFSAITGAMSLFGTFETVAGVAIRDTHGRADSEESPAA